MQSAQTLQQVFVQNVKHSYLVHARDEIARNGPKNGFCVLWYLLWVKAQNAVQGFAGLFPAIVSRFLPSFQNSRNGILTKKIINATGFTNFGDKNNEKVL